MTPLRVFPDTWTVAKRRRVGNTIIALWTRKSARVVAALAGLVVLALLNSPTTAAETMADLYEWVDTWGEI